MAKATIQYRFLRACAQKCVKNIADGIAHVHASFNNTIITITDRRAMHCLGLRLVDRVQRLAQIPPFAAQVASEVAGRAAIEQGIKTWMSKSRAPVLVANLLFALWVHWVSASSPLPMCSRSPQRLPSSKRRRI